MSESTALTADPLSKPMGFQFVSLKELSEEQKQVLKDTVAQGTTDTQLTYFLNVALSQDLDPFKKEVWCILYNGKLTIQTGRDGLLKIAKRDPTFDRIQSAEVREGDTFAMDPITGQVEHRLTTKRGQILGAYAVITRKDGVKLTKYVTYSEYFDPSSPIWKDYPSPLICKCAESVLCKQFANVTGIVAEETMRKDGVVIDSSPSGQEKQSSLKADLIGKIDACQTIEELNALSQASAAEAGKLFGPEKQEVFAAAKRKRAELESRSRPDLSDKVIDHEDGDPTNNDPGNVQIVPSEDVPAPEMSHDEFTGWLDGLKAQETAEGLQDIANAIAGKLSPAQRAEFDALLEKCRTDLTAPKKTAKKK